MKKAFRKVLTAMLCAGVMTMGINTEAAIQGGNAMQSAEQQSDRVIKADNLNLTSEWDKVFAKSDKVDHKKITFVNRYGITLAADMYVPKNAKGKLPAIAVSGPFGAVKEQSSGLYRE